MDDSIIGLSRESANCMTKRVREWNTLSNNLALEESISSCCPDICLVKVRVFVFNIHYKSCFALTDPKAIITSCLLIVTRERKSHQLHSSQY